MEFFAISIKTERIKDVISYLQDLGNNICEHISIENVEQINSIC